MDLRRGSVAGRGRRESWDDKEEPERRDRTAIIRRQKQSSRLINVLLTIFHFPARAPVERQWRSRTPTTWSFSPTETSYRLFWEGGSRENEMEGRSI